MFVRHEPVRAKRAHGNHILAIHRQSIAVKEYCYFLRRVFWSSRHRRGQSIVEMALILPFLLLITLGIIEFGYYVYTYSELENATRRASERASKTPPLSATNPNNSSDLCVKIIKDDAINGVYLSNLQYSNITLSFVTDLSDPNSGTRTVGNQVQATTSYTGQFLTPVGESLFGNTFSFQFTSRRTIVSTDAPRGYNPDCSPKTAP